MGTTNIIFSLLILLLILYSVNLNLTVKVLKKEIFRYKKIIFNSQIKEKNFTNGVSDNDKYNSLRKNVYDLMTDLKDTDFSNYEDVKNDLLLALENIDRYDKF